MEIEDGLEILIADRMVKSVTRYNPVPAEFFEAKLMEYIKETFPSSMEVRMWPGSAAASRMSQMYRRIQKEQRRKAKTRRKRKQAPWPQTWKVPATLRYIKFELEISPCKPDIFAATYNDKECDR